MAAPSYVFDMGSDNGPPRNKTPDDKAGVTQAKVVCYKRSSGFKITKSCDDPSINSVN